MNFLFWVFDILFFTSAELILAVNGFTPGALTTIILLLLSSWASGTLCKSLDRKKFTKLDAQFSSFVTQIPQHIVDTYPTFRGNKELLIDFLDSNIEDKLITKEQAKIIYKWCILYWRLKQVR